MIFKAVKYCLVFFPLISSFHFTIAQSKGIVEIEQSLNANKFDKADNMLQSIIEAYSSEKKADSLVNYIMYVGKIAQAKTNAKKAVSEVKSFIEKIRRISSQPRTLSQAYINAGAFYELLGLNSSGYEANIEALKYALIIPGNRNAKLASIENNLSAFAQKTGDINLSSLHRRKGLKYLLSDPNPDNESLYFAYNGMGSSMWYMSKKDSALYFYNKALQALKKSPPTPQNQFYRPAIVMNNLAGLYQLLGNTTASIDALKTTINNLNQFISSGKAGAKKMNVITFQFEATDNLAGIYKELGDLNKARELLEYSYQQKQKILDPDNPGIFISQILLGQIYFATRDYDKSLEFLNIGLKKIAGLEGNYLLWQGDACHTLALLHEARLNIKDATFYYEKADSLYDATSQGEYDNIYLEFLRNEALFFARNGHLNAGIAKARQGYNYIVKNHGAQTLPAFYELLNLSQVYYLSGDYKKSLAYSKAGLKVVDKVINSSLNLLDSIRIGLKKPKAILQKVKAQYELTKNRDSTSLTALLGQMQEALIILEKQKTLLNDPEDINLLVSDHSDVLEFIKKITLELYDKTGDDIYIDRLVSLHESGMYNRIRARLDKNDSLRFINIPSKTILAEKEIKTSITQSLKGEGTHDEKMQLYLYSVDKWNQFKNKLEIEHPEYYNLRYASIFKSLGDIQKLIPSQTSLVRYFFINKELYALIADQKQKKIIALERKDIEKKISLLSEHKVTETQVLQMLHSCYQQLWEPLSKHIHYKKVIVIPDGILYNLNFEILTPHPIKSFAQLASESLIKDYTFSYNYSLFLLTNKGMTAPRRNFVAFAPGFSDKIKSNYEKNSKKNTDFDRDYLSLLPQPFSIDLALKIQKLLGGKSYINERSTKSAFLANAGEHKIIQISTHAESNNDYPEFSRLIFAKNTAENKEDNSLFVDDIYNCNLKSNLAVLTACESGKPGYQDGEGMISLAHAFNYAGSQSILMGLWKIDEQASVLLMDLFYKNLLKGLPKDEALRLAKLKYLEHADRRMLAPQYWAGLVIMGDTSPVMIQQKSSLRKFVTGGIALLLLGFGYFIFKKTGRKVISTHQS